METVKKLFKENEWALIQEVLKTGRREKDGTKIKWIDYAETFKVRRGESAKQRATAANDIWRRFCKHISKQGLDLTIVKQTLNGNGDILFETRKALPKQEEVSTEGMVINRVTKGPYGDYVSYTNPVTEKQQEETITNVVQKLLDKYLPCRDTKVTYTEYNKEVIVVEPACEIFFGEPNDCKDYLGKRIGVVNLYDAHLDKLPIKSVCGVESTLQENIETFKNTIERIMVELAKIDNLQEIILPIGNDLFHTNGFNSQTKKGTQIEYYGSPEDAYYEICDAITWTIQRLSFLRPVKVIMIKGNHDEDKITTLGYWLERFFTDRTSNMYQKVTVDFLRKQRKYIKFGENLLGFAHGDKEKSKIAQLPLIMATEAKEMWGETTFRKMYLGDLHHGFEYQFLKAKDMPGVEVEYLRSVGTTDSWHEDFGWIGIPKTAYLQIFDEKEGEVIRQKFNIK